MSIIEVIASRVETRPFPVLNIPVILPSEDEPVAADLDLLGHAEGQSFAIEYVDSAKRPSMRRITVWSLVAGSGGIPCLIAHCHERKARRQFRVDRIKSCIDIDGQVYDDVPAFLSETFGMDIALGERSDIDARWQNILTSVKSDAVILAALARSDGKTLASEVQVATDHLSRLAERGGFMLDDAEILAIYRYANRLRPTRDAIERALDHIIQRDHRTVERLLLAAAAVVDADGKRHPDEVALINDVSRHLIGQKLL